MWKYKQIALDRNASLENRQETLDKLGEDGWELKTTHPHGPRSEILVFAKQVPMESAPSAPATPTGKTLLG